MNITLFHLYFLNFIPQTKIFNSSDDFTFQLITKIINTHLCFDKNVNFNIPNYKF